ncbi:MAG: DEAD/DEAH box helicase [Kribbellaceae bacterium]|nr:DEAD/DEAH box helicase [Kribbellaceae bacterium]
MDRDERRQLRDRAGQIQGWLELARRGMAERAAIEQTADDATRHLRGSVVDLRSEGLINWRLLALAPDDRRPLTDIARLTQLPSLAAREAGALRRLTTEAAQALQDVRSVAGARRFFSGAKKRDAGAAAARFLDEFSAWGATIALPALLDRLVPKATQRTVPAYEALADWVGLAPRLSDLGNSAELLPASAVSGLAGAIATVQRAIADEAAFRTAALKAGEQIRKQETRTLLADMPVERLKDATRERIRVGPLTDAGITTVLAVLDRGADLAYLPGIGATTSERMRGAAQTLWQTTYDEMPVRIDIKNRTAGATDLLRRLSSWDAMRKAKGATEELQHAATLTPLVSAVGQATSQLIVIPVDASVAAFSDAVAAVVHRANMINGAATETGSADPWDDFMARPADYFAMLAELGIVVEDEEKSHGDLPDEIVDAVRRLELDTQHLNASLRGYQSFGARFALVQRKVIIGDEMGLGKTVEALAVLAHLRAKGAYHSLVICPAAVVTNWMREVAAKSTLRPHRVHGVGRESAARSWLRAGGVAITTFDTLKWFESSLTSLKDLGCVIVDEAHYINNPNTQRSRRTTRVVEGATRAVLLTGTPLENRIDEFRNLVSYLRTDLVVDADELTPRRFRRQVAPAYLRRNQEDVLTELPELVEVSEWLPMGRHEAAIYRAAVRDGNFMAMRQAAMLSSKSEKIERLIEIVQEAEDNGRRVIVFSHFRDVLDQVAAALPGQVFGPLTGSVSAAKRQNIVDDFSAADHGAVLVAQIVAGGVGLNIQAASVVVICEPQLKPTTEWQAIARAHRMGQLESVQVHRLLSEEGVDQRITDILARKRELFDEFARVSDTAGSAPEALDVSEADLAREVVAAERERLFAETRDEPESDDEAV